MPAGVTPTWEYWDPESSANAFRGKEIMIAPPMQLETATTTYRKNYPLHPVWVRHQEKVNHLNRPVPSYPMTTSSREFYKEHKNAVPPMSAAAKYPQPMFAPKFSVSTTSRDTMGKPNDDAYQRPQSAFGRPPPFKPNNAPLGTTTQRADFLEWKPQAKHPHHAGPEYTTTYRQAYEIIPLPKGIVGGIGLQVASGPYKKGGTGGHYEPMIKQGAPAPQVAQKTFTTTADEQTTADIVVVTKREDRPDGVVLGFFRLAGLKKGPQGIPKIEVILKLQNEKTLHASATYVQGGKKTALTFVSAGPKAPPLRSVTDLSEVPH